MVWDSTLPFNFKSVIYWLPSPLYSSPMYSPLRGAMLSPSVLCTPLGIPCTGRRSLSPLSSPHLFSLHHRKALVLGRKFWCRGITTPSSLTPLGQGLYPHLPFSPPSLWQAYPPCPRATEGGPS